MKPFLGIDLTENKKNEEVHGREFLVQELSAAMSQCLESSAEETTETLKKAKLSLPLRIIQYVCGFSGLLILGGILKADVSFAEGYQNAPALYWIAGICLPIWLVLWLGGKHKEKQVLSTEESTQTISHLEGVSNASYSELGVPADANTVDILSFFYKIKDGEIKVQEKAMQVFQYFNLEYKLFCDEENIYLSSLHEKFAFPRQSLKGIRTVQKHIRLMDWNKEESFNKGIYKEYALTRDNYGCIHCKWYHILEIEHKGETFGVYIPGYDLPAWEKITGLTAE